MGPDGSTWPFLVIIVLNPTIRLYRLSGPGVKSNQFTMSKTLRQLGLWGRITSWFIAQTLEPDTWLQIQLIGRSNNACLLENEREDM